MKSFIFFIAILSIGLMAARPAAAQNYQQLLQEIMQEQDSTKSEIEQLDALINSYQRQLNQAEQKFDKLYEQYEYLKRLLALQQKKIESLQQERSHINAEIAVTERKLDQQEKKLKTLIEEYKQTMRYVYKNGRTSQLALILSSGSLNQMMVRNYYLKEFEKYREGQAEAIKETQEELKESQQQLDNAAERNKNVLAEIRTEKEKLEERTKQQRNNVNLLSRDRVQLQSKLEQEREQKEDLQSTLSQLIQQEEESRAAERGRQRKLAEKEQQQTDITGAEPAAEANAPGEERLAESREFSGEVGFIADAELAKIEESFAALKGHLSWPVESRTVSQHFGRKRHPVYGTVTPNLGIEIVTKPADEVRVVHDGYVFAVQPMTGYGDVVLVKHGKYITAYGNLSRVLVRKNTILAKSDIIGYSGDENSTRGKSVFFMLRAGTQNVDPESWLK